MFRQIFLAGKAVWRYHAGDGFVTPSPLRPWDGSYFWHLPTDAFSHTTKGNYSPVGLPGGIRLLTRNFFLL